MTVLLGVDVGSGSARAGLFDLSGTLLGHGEAKLDVFRPAPGYVQQSADQIWQAVCAAVTDALSKAQVSGDKVGGIGFDATCSLVVRDAAGAPVSVDPDRRPEQDVIMWMDHRAVEDAQAITATGGEPLRHVGGQMSPEMQLPKLRWLKRNLPQAWSAAARFWDLPDWLVHRATGTETRSICSAVCKWGYLAHKGLQGQGWDDSFLRAIGLGDLADTGHSAIGTRMAFPGTALGGLSERAASELGLSAGTAVAASLIDAHAGALGTLGLGGAQHLAGRMAVIAGTSTCHIALSPSATFTPGIWGPYLGAVLPDLWVLEGGQSAAGALIDAVIRRHSASRDLDLTAHAHPAQAIEAHLAQMSDETAFLTMDRHLQPDFHGNRSPLADPTRKGALSGLTLLTDLDDLACDYLATIQALAYGTRHIIEEMRATGTSVDTLVVSGGLARNTLYVREHADATGCRVIVPDAAEPVLLGSAMLAAVAARTHASLPQAMAAMSGSGQEIHPRLGAIAAFHDKKFKVLRRMQDDFSAYQAIMET